MWPLQTEIAASSHCGRASQRSFVVFMAERAERFTGRVKQTPDPHKRHIIPLLFGAVLCKYPFTAALLNCVLMNCSSVSWSISNILAVMHPVREEKVKRVDRNKYTYSIHHFYYTHALYDRGAHIMIGVVNIHGECLVWQADASC